MMPSVKEPLAGLALLVIFGFLIWYNRPIENPRLSDPNPQSRTSRFTGEDAYEAWLWTDPFRFDPADGSGGMAEAWALAAKGGKRDENFSTAVPAGLTCKASLKDALNLDKERSEGIPERIVLAPLVKVAPHTLENKEMRTRQRYAVVAGLVESGYRQLEPGTLHFCSIQENRREYDMRWEHYQHESTSKDGKPEGGKPDIVVAWIDSGILIDESKFAAGHDCTRRCSFAFKNLLKEIRKNNKIYLFDVSNILGPERSSQVEDHINCIEDQNAKCQVTGAKGGKGGQVGCHNDVNIHLIKLVGMESKEKQVKCNDKTGTATSDTSTSGQARKDARATCEEPARQATGGTGQCDSKNPSEETGSEKLAGLLARELTLRGVTHWSEVMTISEQNSEDMAALAGNIRKSLSKLFAEQKCAKPECGHQKSDSGSGAASRPDEIRNVFYLKGLDGNPKKTGNRDEKDKDKKDKNEVRSADKTEKVPSIDLHHSPPLPLGSGQLDYFHRLAGEIKNVHHTVDIDKRNSGIRAVVILGSDFNDKLLIIEALREKMPHLLILTTDLDAQMLHPKYWRSTRNLVVASHFDLLLREKTKEDQNKPDKRPFEQRASQDQFPPFRDSQQTNIFYRTLSIAAADGSGIQESAETFPRIFEVGRNGFVHLGVAENAQHYHPPDDTRKNTAKELWLLLPIAVSLIVFHCAIRPRSGLFSRYLFFAMSVIFALAFGFGTYFFSANKLREPFSFADGVSLWPTLFIQIIAVLLALWFFVQTIRELKESFCNLSRRYFSNISQKQSNPGKCELWLRRLKEWVTTGVLSVVLIGTIIVYAWNDVYPSEFPFSWCFGILAVIAIIYLFFVEGMKITDVSIKHWVETNSWSDTNTDGKEPEIILWDLWKEYYNHGQLGPRSIRVVWIWLIFAIIETLLVYLLPPWPLPWRGATDPANWIDMIHLDLPPWVGVISFTVTMLLLFFVLDAVRLNFYWIKKLCTQHPFLTGCVPHRLGYSSVLQRLDGLENIVSLVAARTQAVDRLIYYPMFCIMLMLLARITYFDNREFPLSKGITFAVAISFLFFSGFVLRHEASELRNFVKKSLQDLRVNNATRRIDETISRIDAIDEGAFQPMLEQPVMQALLIMLASVGLFAGEYLKVFG